MKIIKQIVGVLALLCASHAFGAPEAGKDYTPIIPPQPMHSGNKIEVLEFFFYGCSHCFKLHPLLSAWEKKMPKDVELIYVPTIFNPAWEPMARTFYALESLGQQKRLDDALYDAWNVQNLVLSDEATATDFVAQHGVDRKKFSDAYNAFAMQSRVLRGKQLQQSYNIRGTPTLIVDGKYAITALHPEDTIKVLNVLVDKARKERSSAKSGAARKQ
ncbi:MAG: thiol:disulfide interchange protein DsbA/DsbL [Gallionellaceae bacterium]|nr:thiol:disulfide interchange protein DsbA/DsbL [Gallionellaceae bacterium]